MNTHSVAFHIMNVRLQVGAVALAFLVLEVLSSGFASAQAPPTIINVPGIVWDFQRSHADFNITPGGGFGHYAGNIALSIGPDQKPVFTGGGFLVNAEWTNSALRPIAPHMFVNASAIPLNTPPIYNPATTTQDTFDSDLGPYNSQPPGVSPTFNVGGFMPTVSEPVPFVVNDGDASYKSSQNGFPPNTISSDIHCNNFSTQMSTELRISGDVTILVEGNFVIDQNTHIFINPGSSLTVYVKGLFKVSQLSTINVDISVLPKVIGDPNLVHIINLGSTQMEINQSSEVSAVIISPDAALHLAQGDQFYGKFAGMGLSMDKDSGLHIDTSPIRDSCMNALIDNAGTPAMASTGGITSAATFNEWYNNVLGTNLSMIHRFDMIRDVTGNYEYTTTEFHPIDDRLYGNEGDAHNYFFTYMMAAGFTYDACTDQYFEFSGSDDVWLYIDGQLVIDLGGVIPGTDQVASMDRLGLNDGQTYQMLFFYAQRQSLSSEFNLRTNMVLLPPTTIATGTMGYD